MSLSLSEIEALAKKAARGAGLPWGLAEDAGKAVRWLDAFDLPGSLHLASYLSNNRGERPDTLEGDWYADGPLCPLATGASLSDCAHLIAAGREFRLFNVSHPLLLLPFAGSAAILAGRTISLGWAKTDGCCLDFSDIPGTGIADVTCSPTDDLGKAREPGLRSRPDAQTLDILNALAARTYAPATEASRMLGAGAGNSDND